MGLALFLIPAVLFALAWRSAALLAWGRRGYPLKPLWRRWAPTAAAVLYPLYLPVVLMFRHFYDVDRFGVDGAVWAFIVASSLPTLALGALAAAAARSWIPAAGAAAASVLGPLAFFLFERGTHGPWYVRSESLAITLSVLVGSAAWLLCMGAGTLLWGLSARRARGRAASPRCPRCNYDLHGLPPSAPCPECGAPGIR